MTKLGNIDVTNTTRLSAATRSRNIHMTQIIKADPSGRKLESQYETIEKSMEIRTINSRMLAMKAVLFVAV
jgi:hypothetical protein